MHWLQSIKYFYQVKSQYDIVGAWIVQNEIGLSFMAPDNMFRILTRFYHALLMKNKRKIEPIDLRNAGLLVWEYFLYLQSLNSVVFFVCFRLTTYLMMHKHFQSLLTKTNFFNISCVFSHLFTVIAMLNTHIHWFILR